LISEIIAFSGIIYSQTIFKIHYRMIRSTLQLLFILKKAIGRAESQAETKAGEHRALFTHGASPFIVLTSCRGRVYKAEKKSALIVSAGSPKTLQRNFLERRGGMIK
jgi:hypothetical protein